MATADELKVKITADNRDFKQAVGESEAATSRFGKAGGVALRGVTKAAKAAAVAFTAVATGAAGALGYGVKLASDLQQAKIGFETMLGSAEKADKFVRDLADFSARTPFELQGVIDGARRLMAMGVAADRVIPMMKDVGNAVAAMGGGPGMIDGVTRALGQMNAKGVVSAQEMLQLAEQGIPAWEMLAETLGVSVPEAMKQVENRAVSAEQFLSAFHTGVAARFTGAMEAQSQTLAGLFSTLKDNVGLALADMAGPIVAQLTAILPTITERFNALSETLKPIVAGFFDALPGIFEALQPFIEGAKTLFFGLWDAVKKFIDGFVAGFGGSGGANEVITFFANLLRDIGRVLSWLSPLFKALGFTLGLLVRALITVANWVTKLRDAFVALKDVNLREVGKNILMSLWEGIKSAWGWVGDKISEVGENIKNKFKETFGIASPSKVFREYGENLGDGLGEGIGQSFNAVNAAMGGQLSDMGSVVNSGLSRVQTVVSDKFAGIERSARNTLSNVGETVSEIYRQLRDGPDGTTGWLGWDPGMSRASGTVRGGINTELGNFGLQQLADGRFQATQNGMGFGGGGTLEDVARQIRADLVLLQGLAAQMGAVPQLATGGIVRKPTLALIGEAGPEAVVPLNGKHGFGGATTNTYNINVNGTGDPRSVAQEVVRLIQRGNERSAQYGSLSGRRPSL